MPTPLRTRNRFISERRFVAFAAWRAPRSGLLLWPSAWLELGREPSLEVRMSRLVVGWFHWRAQVELGTWSPIALSGPVDWERMGIDSFLAWARKSFGRNWGRIDVERLFRADPAWRRLALLGTARNHYVRVVLARSMLSGHEPSQLGANDSLRAALQAPSHAPAPADSAEDSRSMMEGLEELGQSIRGRTPPAAGE